MEVIWSKGALQSLRISTDWYAETMSEQSARKFSHSIIGLTKILAENPELGRVELSVGNITYRGIVCAKKYKIIYYITTDRIITSYIWKCVRDLRLFADIVTQE